MELDPPSPEPFNYLGYMWAEQGTNLVKAREMIQKAVNLEPKSAAYLDSLGWVLFKLGELQPALENTLKSLQFSPEPDATILDHLADIYLALKQPEKARDAWKKSLQIEPNDAVKKKLNSLPKQ